MAAGYAPELTLRAVVAGAPAGEYMDTVSIDPGLRDGLFPLTVVGASIEFRDLHPAHFMTLVGQANYQRTSESKCANGADWFVQNVAFNSYPFTVAQANLNSIQGYADFAAANSPGHRPITAPVLVGEIDEDPMIWPIRVDNMVSSLRTQPGSNVTYCRYQSNGASDYITKLYNHFNVTDRLWDGVGQRCTNQAGASVSSVTVQSFLNAAGFAL